MSIGSNKICRLAIDPKINAGLILLENKHMNADLVKKAMEKVQNPYVLVNIVSRRVRELNNGARPLIADTNFQAADIALLEIIEGKMDFEMPEIVELTRPTGHNRRRPQGWSKLPQAKAA